MNRRVQHLVAAIGISVAATMQIGGGCGPGGPPPTDSCGSPKSTSFESLEVGPELLPNRAFEAWAPDDTAYITEGTQGGYMIVFSLRLGAGAPACISQKTSIKQNGSVIASENSALNTYDNGDGTRSTHNNYLVFGDSGPPLGSKVVVTTTAGGKTASATLTVAPNRNKLESLTVVTASPHVGYSIDFQLKARVAPPYSGMAVTASTSSVSVASASPPPYIYDDTTTFQGSAYSAGSATITVTMSGSNENVTAPVTVIP